jgi:hypothetical protein
MHPPSREELQFPGGGIAAGGPTGNCPGCARPGGPRLSHRWHSAEHSDLEAAARDLCMQLRAFGRHGAVSAQVALRVDSGGSAVRVATICEKLSQTVKHNSDISQEQPPRAIPQPWNGDTPPPV